MVIFKLLYRLNRLTANHSFNFYSNIMSIIAEHVYQLGTIKIPQTPATKHHSLLKMCSKFLELISSTGYTISVNCTELISWKCIDISILGSRLNLSKAEF